MIALALDAILGLVIVEALGLVLYHRVSGRGIAPRDLIPNLAAGFFLMLTARLALEPGLTSLALAACLLAALCAHLVDLARRWRR